jgi:hypothetical protein
VEYLKPVRTRVRMGIRRIMRHVRVIQRIIAGGSSEEETLLSVDLVV